MVTPTEIDTSGILPPQQQPQDSRTELGQEDFLTLMITQFRNQDPFEPMDNGEFLGQLAQFSTVSGIDSLNSAFGSLAGALRDEQALQAANLVGRTVLVDTDAAWFDGAEPLGGAVELGAAASNVQIEITDATGQLVQRLDLGQQAAGTVRFDWDGRDSAGDIAAPGAYKVSARVIRGENTESIQAYIRADVESVTLGQYGGDMTLNMVGGERLSLAQVYQII